MSRKARTHRLRLLSPIFAGILCFFLCCAPADALTLYDDFSGQYIQALQWSTTDFVREVQNGALRSRLRLFRDSDTNTLFMNAPGLAAHIEADVTLVAASSVTDGYAYARLGKSLYNNGQGASGSYLGDVYAQLRIGSEDGVLVAYCWVYDWLDASGTTTHTLSKQYFPITPVLDQPYKGELTWNQTSKTLTCGLAGNQPLTWTSTDPTTITAHVPWAVIGTLVSDPPASTETAGVAATFDNFAAKNSSGTPIFSDDFSSPFINSSNWTDYESVREIRSGQLVMSRRSSVHTIETLSTNLSFPHPEPITCIQSDVTLLAYDNSHSATVRAALRGVFFNDGDPQSPPGSWQGEIGAWVRIGGTGTSPAGLWRVFRYIDPVDSSKSTAIQSGSFTTPIVVGTPYTLSLCWENNQFTFKINGEQHTYAPSMQIQPSNKPTRVIDVRIDNTSQETYVEAAFDNVMTGTASVTLQTIPPGNQVSIDSVTYTSPQTFSRAQGSSHLINVPSPQAAGTGVRYAFSRWSDGGPKAHYIVAPSSASTYTAYFSTQYELLTSTNAPGFVTVVPACDSGCWANNGSVFNLLAVPAAGYVFGSWAEDCTSPLPYAAVVMDASKSCTANVSMCGNQPVRRNGSPYNGLQQAFGDAQNGNTIQTQATNLAGAFDFNKAGVGITLKGGYNCDYTSSSSATLLSGSLTISNGTIAIDRIVIR